MSHEQLSTAYGASDVVVTPSVYVDPFVLVNTEAMANAKPVVGTTFGGTPEIVVDRKTGFVRNPNNFEEFAEALVTLLQDESLAKQMGEEGLQRVQEQFTIENMTEKYLKLYTS